MAQLENKLYPVNTILSTRTLVKGKDNIACLTNYGVGGKKLFRQNSLNFFDIKAIGPFHNYSAGFIGVKVVY